MRLRKFYLLIFLQVAVALTAFMTLEAYGTNTRITEDKAIELANKEGKKLGYDVDSMRVKATHYTTPSNPYLSDSDDRYTLERRDKLKNKEYWAVYYVNPKFTKGGDLCIFIDSNTGEVA